MDYETNRYPLRQGNEMPYPSFPVTVSFTRRIDVNLNSTSMLLNPMQPPIYFLELRFHFNYRELLRNLEGDLIEIQAYPTAPTSSFLFQIRSYDHLFDQPPYKSHLDGLFSFFNLDDPLHDFLAYRIASFLVFIANKQPFLGFHVVTDVGITHQDLIDEDPIDLTILMDEKHQEVVPRGASSSALNS
ncbi:hypothetical protein GH714_009926 [Hevea brasiliensis]|uniref:Uncharacterized protein n=1 Tax=Hevea brasiliensis TaxID=3981 RepID=A0A6A6MM34_HEVBR|nr:uncharacterized protein LOC110641193 [Hevea brasiliensis]KAF2313236.1 hypothetical protein GH714_009926 [Hevea brasiliensis]